MAPEVWLSETASAKRSGRRMVHGVGQPGLMFSFGSAQVMGWGALGCAAVLLGLEGLQWFTAALALLFVCGAWVGGWPFAVVVTRKGILTRRGFVRFDRIVAVGWAWSGDPLLPFWESWVPVLIVRGRSELCWRPLPELRRGGVSRELSRERALLRLTGPNDVLRVPMPSEVVRGLDWPWS